jgi:hypothetical protein
MRTVETMLTPKSSFICNLMNEVPTSSIGGGRKEVGYPGKKI